MKRCQYCRATEDLTIDHKKPIIQGGTDKLSNLTCLCRRCNTTKSGLSDRQVKRLWKWFMEIQKSRVEKGVKPYFHKLSTFKENDGVTDVVE